MKPNLQKRIRGPPLAAPAIPGLPSGTVCPWPLAPGPWPLSTMSRKIPADGQQHLLFDRREKLDLIRRAMSHNFRLSRVVRRNVCDLLVQIELCTFPEGCYVRMEVLASRIGVSRRQLQKIVRRAEHLGLLDVDRHRLDGRTGGRGPSKFLVQWEALSALDRAEQSSERLEKSSERSEQSSARLVGAHTSLSAHARAGARPFPTALSPPPPSPCESGGGIFSSKIREQLESLGLGAADIALERAALAGASQSDVEAIIAHWIALRPAWGIGALYRRISRASPRRPAAEGWPRPSEEFEKQRARDQRREAEERQRAETERQRQIVAAEAQREDNVEAVYGRLLDSMAPDQLEQLAHEQLAGKPLLAKLFAKHGIHRGFARDELLSALSRREALR